MPKRKRDDMENEHTSSASNNNVEPTTIRVTRSRTKASNPAESKASTAKPPKKKAAAQPKKSSLKANPPQDTTHQSDAPPPFTIPSSKPGKEIFCQPYGPSNSAPSLIFTHGAGGGMSNPATALFATGFATVSPVLCFQGTMNLSSRVSSFESVLQHSRAQHGANTPIALGGRSMGARAAVMTAQQSQQSNPPTAALVLVSYPLVGASKGDLRDHILLDLPEGVDVLFVSGSNDSMCDLAQLREVRGKMKAKTWMVEVQGADHGMGLKGPQKAGIEVMRKYMGEMAARWLTKRDEGKRSCVLSWDEEEGEVKESGWQSE